MPSIGMYALRSKPLQYIGMAHVAVSIINFLWVDKNNEICAPFNNGRLVVQALDCCVHICSKIQCHKLPCNSEGNNIKPFRTHPLSIIEYCN